MKNLQGVAQFYGAMFKKSPADSHRQGLCSWPSSELIGSAEQHRAAEIFGFPRQLASR